MASAEEARRKKRNAEQRERRRLDRLHLFEARAHAAGPVASSPDGRYFAVGIRSRRPKPSIVVYEMASGKPVRTFDQVGGFPKALTFTADGRRLVSAMDDTTVLVWDLKPAPAVQPAPPASAAGSAAAGSSFHGAGFGGSIASQCPEVSCRRRAK